MSAPEYELRDRLNTLLHAYSDRFGDPSPDAVKAFTDAGMASCQSESRVRPCSATEGKAS